jgi:hypothetical protein
MYRTKGHVREGDHSNNMISYTILELRSVALDTTPQIPTNQGSKALFHEIRQRTNEQGDSIASLQTYARLSRLG